MQTPRGQRDFDEFYRAEVDGLARALALALGDVDLAQEAVDEAMARAYQRWRTVGSYQSPAGWVYRVGVNWARNRVRNRRREVLTTDWADDGSASPGDANPPRDPDLHAAIAHLSLDARSVVVLRYLLGWSTIETARALDISPGTVKSRLARALGRLEQTLEQR